MLLKIFIFNSLTVLGTIITVSATEEDECGIVKFIDPQIIGGTRTSRGEWPFIAALYYTDDAKFFCGSTIISANHVLTAAHCVQQKSSSLKLTPEDVVVALGAYNLDSKIERGVQQKDVIEIHVHPEWKVYHDKYDADIAIFVLSSSIVFTNYIRPICIPKDDEPFAGVRGSIVGWGLTENRTISKRESIPRQAYTYALNDSYCYTTDRFLAIFSSTRTFCGGGDGGSPNKGDSGGGMFVLSGRVWMQYGIISASLSDESGIVLPHTFSVYTNVKSFRDWINRILYGSEGDGSPSNVNDSSRKKKIRFWCTYQFTSFYTCTLWESNVTVDNLEVEAFSGNHLPEHTDLSVTQIWFWQGKLAYIPAGIGLFYQNLEKFLVGYHGRHLGLKKIQRSNFEHMPKLNLLQLHESYIETLDADTLWDIPHLDFFVLIDSKVKEIPTNFFEKSTKVRHVDLSGNQLEHLPLDLFKNNPLIEELKLKGNKLRTISIDFNAFKAIKLINLHDNSCIDTALEDVHSLSELQELIGKSCSIL